MSGIRDSYLGVSFSSNYIYFTELTEDAGKVVLDHVETVKVDFDFEEDLSKLKSNNKALTNISQEIQKYLNLRKKQFTKISLTIGTSQAFMLITPLDISEGKKSLSTKIYWELSNYFPETYNDYVVNTYRLNSVMPCSKTDEFLLIAVLKNTIEFVKRIFRLCNLNLSIIDIDHFAAEHILRKNRLKNIENKNIILLGLKKGRFDFGLIESKKYKFYSYTKYNSSPEYNLALIRKLNYILNSAYVHHPVDVLILYGDEIRDDTIDALKKNNGQYDIEILNPFENIMSSAEFLKNEDLRKSVYKYSAGCGVAMRSIRLNSA